MTKLNPTAPAMLRIDSSRYSQYLYKGPELTFWQKMGRGLGKAASFLGPIGAAVTAVAVPGFGTAAALGIYGASKLAGKATSNALASDAAASKEYNAEMSRTPIGLPGFFDSNPSPATIETDFIAPSEFGASIQRTVNDREQSLHDQLESY